VREEGADGESHQEGDEGEREFGEISLGALETLFSERVHHALETRAAERRATRSGVAVVVAVTARDGVAHRGDDRETRPTVRGDARRARVGAHRVQLERARARSSRARRRIDSTDVRARGRGRGRGGRAV